MAIPEKKNHCDACRLSYLRSYGASTINLCDCCKDALGSREASPKRVNELNNLEEQVIDGADALVNNAVECGDLKFSPAIGSDAIVFANWSIAFGSNALAQNASNSRCIQRIQDPFSVLHNANMLLDGLGWSPLSTEWDYRKTWRRVEQELFSEELAYLESVNR